MGVPVDAGFIFNGTFVVILMPMLQSELLFWLPLLLPTTDLAVTDTTIVIVSITISLIITLNTFAIVITFSRDHIRILSIGLEPACNVG